MSDLDKQEQDFIMSIITKIRVGDRFVNLSNGGQKVRVTTVNFNGQKDVIGYVLLNPFHFNSKQKSYCDKESFIKTFNKDKKSPNSKIIKIAKDFVAQHENANIEDWHPLRMDDESKYEYIYDNLCAGTYGEAESNDNEFEIEIGSHESKSGNPIIFTWEALDETHY